MKASQNQCEIVVAFPDYRPALRAWHDRWAWLEAAEVVLQDGPEDQHQLGRQDHHLPRRGSIGRHQRHFGRGEWSFPRNCFKVLQFFIIYEIMKTKLLN